MKVKTILSLFTDASPAPRAVPGTLPVMYHCIFLNSVCVLNHSVFSNSVILWTVACQVPLSMEFSRQEYWNGFPVSTPGDLLDPGIKDVSLTSLALAGGFFYCYATLEVPLLQ